MTKSHKTMYELCTEAVKKIGPRRAQDGRYGYYLTVAQIREIYYANGFSRRATRTIPGHIASWAYIEWVGYDEMADMRDPETVIWWPCQTDRTRLTMAAERILADPEKLVLDPPVVTFGGE